LKYFQLNEYVQNIPQPDQVHFDDHKMQYSVLVVEFQCGIKWCLWSRSVVKLKSS